MQWSRVYGISRRTHPKYLDALGNSFYEFVKDRVDKRMVKNTGSSFTRDRYLEELYNEIIEHNNMCKEAAENFYGREDLIKEVNEIFMQEKKINTFIYDT